MDLEDQYRFQVEAVAGEEADIVLLTCDRCRWDADITSTITLADLNQRADEHTEVCR